MRNLIILCGFMLWIPQVWAATFGGGWSKAETWVGGKVPGKNDSVVVNGVVSTYSASVAGLTVSPGATIINSSSISLTINGNVINNGSILNKEKFQFYIKITGNRPLAKVKNI